MLSSRDINLLRHDVAANCRIFIDLCKQDGYPALVTGTVRDDEYQMQCYKKGTGGKPPATFHSVKAGLAFDICKNVKGQEYSDPDYWRGVSEIGKKIGFTWGGDWKTFPDKPHFQWDAHGQYTGSNIRAGNYPPKMPIYQAKEDENVTKQELNEIIENVLKSQKQVVWEKLEEIPEWGQATVKKLLERGAMSGTGSGLGLNYDQLRVLVINDNAGLYGG